METTPSIESRRSERRPRKIEVTLLGKSGGFEYQEPAHTTDLSNQGMGILTDNAVDRARPLNAGQIVYIYGSDGQGQGFCRVAWARADLQLDRTRAGLQFLD